MKKIVLGCALLWSAGIYGFELTSQSRCLMNFTGEGSEKEIRAVRNETVEFFKSRRKLPNRSELAKTLGTKKTNLRAFFDQPHTPDGVKEIIASVLSESPSDLEEIRVYVAEKVARLIKENLRFPTKKEILDATQMRIAELSVLFPELDQVWTYLKELRDCDIAANKVARTFAKVAKNIGHMPDLQEVADELKVDKKGLKQLIGEGKLFDDFSHLKSVSIEISGSSFEHVLDQHIFTKERVDALEHAIKTRKRLILVTAVAGDAVYRDMLAALLNYCEHMDAEIIVYPANMQTHGLDDILLTTPKVHILTNTIQLTNKWALNNIKIMAKQVYPLTGLKDIGKRGQGQVVGSPKMHVEIVPTIKNAWSPHHLMTTGAITNEKAYAGRKLIQARTDYKASEAHMLGALILEKHTGKNAAGETYVDEYFARHIEYIPEELGFTDMGMFYGAGGQVHRDRPEALVLGDIHVGDLDEEAFEAVIKVIDKVRPKRVFLHDVFNGHSINHHERGKSLTRAGKAAKGMLSLADELDQVARFINRLLAVRSDFQVMVVPSNHDLWLVNWLEANGYINDPYNMNLGVELANAMTNGGYYPLEFALKEESSAAPRAVVAEPDRVTFLKLATPDLEATIEEDPGQISARFHEYGIYDGRRVVLDLHGHAGANGSKGSINAFRYGADRSMTGHTHTYRRLNGAVIIGTMTNLILPYTSDGISNWVNASGIVYASGAMQVIEYTNGDWYDDSAGKIGFPEEYPKVIPNNERDSNIGQMDQWGEG